jgi:hypothetical protein
MCFNAAADLSCFNFARATVSPGRSSCLTAQCSPPSVVLLLYYFSVQITNRRTAAVKIYFVSEAAQSNVHGASEQSNVHGASEQSNIHGALAAQRNIHGAHFLN